MTFQMSVCKKHDAISNERQLCVCCRFYIPIGKASNIFSLFVSTLNIKMNTATGMHPLSQNVVWEEGVTSVSGEIPVLLQYNRPLYMSRYTLAGKHFTVAREAGISENVLSLWHND